MFEETRSVEEPSVFAGPWTVEERLADGLRAVRFRYRGLDEENRLGEWQDRWETSEMLPLQVKVEVEAVRGGRWPDLIVTLARSEGGAGGGLLQGGSNPVLP